MDQVVEGLGGDMTVIVHDLMKGRKRGNRWGIYITYTDEPYLQMMHETQKHITPGAGLAPSPPP